jgi:uncharacterized protein DUF6587
MNRTLDELLVALALAASAGYAVLSLGPKGLRMRLYAALAQAMQAAPAALHLQAIVRRLNAAAQRSGGACGGCETCAPRADAAADGREVRVPLDKIARRGRSVKSGERSKSG